MTPADGRRTGPLPVALTDVFMDVFMVFFMDARPPAAPGGRSRRSVGERPAGERPTGQWSRLPRRQTPVTSGTPGR